MRPGLRDTGRVAGDSSVQSTADSETGSPTGGDVDGSAAEVVETKNKRGRETAGDMVRSLGIVLLLVVVIWWLARPPATDVQEVRVVDPASDVQAFTAAEPGAPVPAGLPEAWRSTSSTLTPEPVGLRIGYVTPSGAFAEYAASTGPRAEHLEAQVGDDVRTLEPVQVGGASWEQLRDGNGSLSLVRSYGDVTVVLGGLRAKGGPASLAELQALAASLPTPAD